MRRVDGTGIREELVVTFLDGVVVVSSRLHFCPALQQHLHPDPDRDNRTTSARTPYLLCVPMQSSTGKSPDSESLTTSEN